MTTVENSRAMAEAAIREIDPLLHEADRLAVEASVWKSFGFEQEATALTVRSEEARARLKSVDLQLDKLKRELVEEISERVMIKLAVAFGRATGLLPGGPS